MKKENLKTGIKNLLLAAAFLTAAILLQALSPLQTSAVTDNQPPSVPTGIIASNITNTSITISWAEAHDNIGVKGYQVYQDGRKIRSVTKTCYTSTSLIPGKKYTFTVRAYDEAGNISGYSSPITEATASDTQNPTRPEEPVVLSSTYTSITVSWKASTDNTGVKGYEIYCNEKKVSTTEDTYYAIKNLLPGTKYSVFIKAYDIVGNYSTQSNVLSASTPADSQPPSVPAGLKASSVSGMEITLTWSASSDNVKVKTYELFCNGSKLSSSSKTGFTNKKLIPGKSYTYTVRAIDTTGNISDFSSPLKVSTPADNEAPTAPSGLKVKSATRSSASLTWNASTDNVKVKGYKIYCNGIEVADTTKTHYTAKSPFRLGLDVFYVKAYDLVNNISGSSNKVTVITY